MWSARRVLVFALVLAAFSAHAEAPPAGSRIGPDGAPIWKWKIQLSDGRTFVTDGAMTLDAALAKPKELPTQAVPESAAKTIEGYLGAKREVEIGLGQLRTNKRDQAYVTPNQLRLNVAYVDYLAQTLTKSDPHLRLKGELDPVIIMFEGKAVGLLMPLRR